MKKEDIQININEEETIKMSDYNEDWFQAIIRTKHHFFLQHFFASNHSD
jgi:hypothetical protein